MLAGYVDAMLISYVLKGLSQSALIVKPAMLESMAMKDLNLCEKRERKSKEKMTLVFSKTLFPPDSDLLDHVIS